MTGERYKVSGARVRRRPRLWFAAACLALSSCAGTGPAPSAPPPPPETPHHQVVRLAGEIRRAAYADDRDRLKALIEEMAPFTDAGAGGSLASRAHYWRGFAFWSAASRLM